MLNLLNSPTVILDHLSNILIGAASIVILVLLIIGFKKLFQFINSKIDNEDAKRWLEEIEQIVGTGVLATFQTYVSNIKGTDAWTEEAQKKALSECLKTVEERLTSKTLHWIEEKHGDIENYLIAFIEANVFKSKE